MACIEIDCDKNIFAKSKQLCGMHYYRLLRHGSTAKEDLPIKKQAKDWQPRFWKQVNKSKSCWNWIGAVDSYGYGVFQLAYPKRQTVKAHRISYEILQEKIADNMTIDHLCFNKLCVNPKHLEVVSALVNGSRARQRQLAK
jgi:hypothetical protein